MSRSGIRERRISHVQTSDLAVVAARRALAAADLDVGDIDSIICATVSPELLVPSTASIIQKKLGVFGAAAHDINVGCSGFLYGLATANGLLQTGIHERILLIGVERLTWYIDWTERNVAVLFGDGAGAAVMERRGEGEGLLSARLGCEGEAGDILMVPGWGTSMDRSAADALHFNIQFNGKEVYRRAVNAMCEDTQGALDDAGIVLDDVALVVPHQANKRILDAVAKRLGLDEARLATNLEFCGNTSAASIPMALSDALDDGRIAAGDYVVFTAFGAGLSRGAVVMKWGDRIEAAGTSDAELVPCDTDGAGMLKHLLDVSRSLHPDFKDAS
jgi:3-oxoacyl-[acyl-carrier-protein] synthase-3